jgi:hypothetical protein
VKIDRHHFGFEHNGGVQSAFSPTNIHPSCPIRPSAIRHHDMLLQFLQNNENPVPSQTTSVDADNLVPSTVAVHSRTKVVDEGRFRTRLRMVDVITELVLPDLALVGLVILPVAVEDAVGVEVVAIEGQLFYELGSIPAREVLSRAELADVDGLEFRKTTEEHGEELPVCAGVDEGVVLGDGVGVGDVDVVNLVHIPSRGNHSLPIPKLFPTPHVAMLRLLQRLRHQLNPPHSPRRNLILRHQRQEENQVLVPWDNDTIVADDVQKSLTPTSGQMLAGEAGAGDVLLAL